MKRILLSWSSGKDSAWALHVLRRSTAYDVVGLLTTFNHAADRVAMHAVRRSLVEQQAAAVGIPLWPVQLPWPCSNSEYDTIMAQECEKAVSKGIAAIAFGDLFLEDVRSYREKRLEGSGLQPLFPIWGSPTRALAQEMIFSGMRAKLTCIDTRKLDPSFAGRDFDQQLLSMCDNALTELRPIDVENRVAVEKVFVNANEVLAKTAPDTQGSRDYQHLSECRDSCYRSPRAV